MKKLKCGELVEHDFSKKRKTLYHGVRVLLYFWRGLSRDNKESALTFMLQKTGEQRRDKRERRSMAKSQRG